MLYSQRRHESLQSSPWKEAQAHNVIQAIVTDTEQQWNPQKTYWPIHPLDRDFPPPVPTYTCLYLGAAGVLWALDYLHKATAIDLSLNPAVLIGAVYATYHQAPDTGAVVPSLFMGEVGIALVHWRLAPDDAIANRLYEQIEANIANPTNEAFWAAPGTMLAALWMSEWTGETKWIELYRRNVDYLWQQWQYNSDFDCYLWIQDLYGRTRQMTGPAHGYAGNLYALLRGVDHLATEKQQLLYKRTAQLLAKTAQVKDDAANWLPNVTTRSWLPKQLLAQWCHGAPGMVTSLAQTYPLGIFETLDRLLLQAGELTWQAGPLKKGSNLCHGTAGNGYAFLKLFARTQDEQWLERARQFAMHAIGQYHRCKEQYGLGRYTLWTGDLGLAIYLWHCIQAEAAFPSLDVV